MPLNSRTSSHKPGDELIANFRQQFPEVSVAASSGPTAHGTIAAADHPALVAPTTQQPYVILYVPVI